MTTAEVLLLVIACSTTALAAAVLWLALPIYRGMRELERAATEWERFSRWANTQRPRVEGTLDALRQAGEDAQSYVATARQATQPVFKGLRGAAQGWNSIVEGAKLGVSLFSNFVHRPKRSSQGAPNGR